MSDEPFQTYGIIMSLAWGAAAPMIGEALGDDARALVSAVREREPGGSWWGFTVEGDLAFPGGVRVDDGLAARLADGVAGTVTAMAESLEGIVGLALRAQPAEAKGDPPAASRWVETALRIIVGSDVHEAWTYVPYDAVEKMAEAFRERGSPPREEAEARRPSAGQTAGQLEGPTPQAAADGDMSPFDPPPPPPEVRAHRWPRLQEGQTRQGGVTGLEMFYDVPLSVTAELGRVSKKVEDVMTLGPGAVVELDRMVGETVDIFANGQWIGRGEVVVVEENFGVRITEIGTAADRVSKLRLREGS